MKSLLTACFIIFSISIFAQEFLKVTDPNNPIVTAEYDLNYSGTAWIDYDNDGDIDLFVTNNFLFRNEGNGNFTKVETNFGEGQGGQSNGTTWGDYDNDGDLDNFIASVPSKLYRNDGNGKFTEINFRRNQQQ